MENLDKKYHFRDISIYGKIILKQTVGNDSVKGWN
jgi:hypothetical protein